MNNVIDLYLGWITLSNGKWWHWQKYDDRKAYGYELGLVPRNAYQFVKSLTSTCSARNLNRSPRACWCQSSCHLKRSSPLSAPQCMCQSLLLLLLLIQIESTWVQYFYLDSRSFFFSRFDKYQQLRRKQAGGIQLIYSAH